MVANTSVQKKYLAQVYNIAVDYARGIFEALPEKKFEFAEVKELSQTAQEWYKESIFRPSQGERLAGYAPPVSIYNV